MKVLINSLIAVAMTAACLAAPAHAELEGIVTPGCNQNCDHVLPRLVVPDGWVRDDDFSARNNVNFIYPPADPNNVGIYATALDVAYEADTLERQVAEDRDYFLERNPGMTAEAGPDFTTQDGQVLHSVEYIPAGDQNWDVTAYGEETDPQSGIHYYLTFTLTAPTKELRDRYMPVFTAVMAAYHK